MEDKGKTKKQLLQEIKLLRQEISQLKSLRQGQQLPEILASGVGEQKLEAFSSVIEQSESSIAIINNEGVVEYANPKFLSLNKYKASEIIGKPWRSFVSQHSTLREKYQEIHETVLKKKATWRSEVLDNSSNGKPSWRESKIFPIKDKKGDILLSVYMSDDITYRIEAEEALKKSEAEYREMFEISPQAIVMMDRDGTLLEANKKVYDLFGIPSEEIIGKNFINLPYLPEESRAKAIESFRKRIKGDSIPPYEIEIISKSGDMKIGQIMGTLVRDKKGEIARTLIMISDITQQKRNEAEARKLQTQVQHAQKLESLGVLAGGIAHDFNNLLMGVLGNASLALKNITNKTEAGKYIDKIEKTAYQAAELTNQLLAYSGKGKFQVQSVNLSKIIEEITQLLKVSISKKVTLRYDFEESLPLIEADVSQLNQVIMNLIVNASEAMGDKSGIVSIRTGIMNLDKTYLADTYLDENLPGGEYVTLEVSDNGAGMDEKTQAQIFEPFFTTKLRGHGLGLAAVLGIVRGHKGAIKVYSEPGQGTTIKVLLPTQKVARKDLAEETVIKSDILAGKTILIVDDEETVRDVVSNMLRDSNLKVMTAVDGKEGVQLFKKYADEIFMVLLDVTMPEMNGEEAFRELCKIKSDVRVVLTSGYNEQDATSYFVGKGLAGFIQKPFSLEKLLKILI